MTLVVTPTSTLPCTQLSNFSSLPVLGFVTVSLGLLSIPSALI